MIVEVLSRQGVAAANETQLLEPVERMLPGLGTLLPVTVCGNAASVGQSLSELNVRGLTGAAVLAITREGQEVLLPSGGERVHVQDKLVLAGTKGAVEAARELLLRPSSSQHNAPSRG
jgi:CPA2 family monovalent cation:H+ antiporter-2